MLRLRLSSFGYAFICCLLATTSEVKQSFAAVGERCGAAVCRSHNQGDDWPQLLFLRDLGNRNAHSRANVDERIETDRHDFTQSTKTVGRGVSQLEFGYTYFYRDQNEEIEQSHTGPEMLLRVGLTEHIEFRLRFNYAWQFGEGESREGSEDLRWAFKLETTEAEGYLPESTVELRFTAPTGGGTWSTDQVEFGLDFIYGWPWGKSWELYGSTGFTTNGLGEFSLVAEEPSADDFIAWSQSVAIGIEATDRVTIYHELFGIASDGRENDLAVAFYNIGIDYYLSDDIVLDVRAGVGLTSESEDFFIGTGGGVRF